MDSLKTYVVNVSENIFLFLTVYVTGIYLFHNNFSDKMSIYHVHIEIFMKI